MITAYYNFDLIFGIFICCDNLELTKVTLEMWEHRSGQITKSKGKEVVNKSTAYIHYPLFGRKSQSEPINNVSKKYLIAQQIWVCELTTASKIGQTETELTL